MARRLKRYPVVPDNALTYTYRIVPFWRVALIYIVQNLARHCPSLTLKNWLYRRLGVKIGKKTTIALRAQLDWLFPQLTTIGDNVIIGLDVCILTHEFLRHEYRLGPVEIEDDVVIGARAIILAGTRIGSGAIVGAGAVVTRDVPPGMLVVGNPARVMHRNIEEAQGASGR